MIRSHSSIDLYRRTLERTDFLRTKGYIVVEIWECEAKHIKDFVEWFEYSLENKGEPKIVIKQHVLKTSYNELFSTTTKDMDSIVNRVLLNIQLQLNSVFEKLVRAL
jgi:hypothetical protein